MHHQEIFKNNMGYGINNEFVACIQACQSCVLDCEVCLAAMIGQDSSNDCPLCCYECVEICLQCARALTRNSRFVKEYCGLCAKVCGWCAEQCAKHNMDHCQRCADSCLVCVEECRKIAL